MDSPYNRKKNRTTLNQKLQKLKNETHTHTPKKTKKSQ